jgi:hypothetical protein
VDEKSQVQALNRTQPILPLAALHAGGSHTAVRALEKAMLDYLDHRNQNPEPFVWTCRC